MTQISEALAALLDEVDRNTCRHENTERLREWTLCCDCDMEWSDDQGGFVPYSDSPAVAMARAALAAADADAPHPLPEREDTLLRDYGE